MQVTRFLYGEEPFTARWGELALREPGSQTECWLLPERAGATSAMLPLPGLGRVGHFGARDRESAVAVLEHATRALFEQGALKVLAPMDGTTWERYRLALNGPQDSFLGEPTNPPEYAAWLEAAGFGPDQHYTSTLTTDLERVYPELERLERRLAGRVAIRPLRDFESELESLHGLSLEAFAHNAYFTPISLAEFKALYRPLAPLLRNELVLIAEEGPRPVGFVLSYPDRVPGRLVLKTLATAPDRRGLGLGTVLTARIHQVACQLGFKQVIHALMHSQNPSQHVSQRASAGRALLWRRYALYSRGAA